MSYQCYQTFSTLPSVPRYFADIYNVPLMSLGFNFITFIEDGKTGGGKDASGMYSVSFSVTLREKPFGFYIFYITNFKNQNLNLCIGPYFGRSLK